MADDLSQLPTPQQNAGGLFHYDEYASVIEKHSLTIEGHRTSISLERIFWDQMNVIASRENRSLVSLVAGIDSARGKANLSSAIRIFVLRSALAR